MYFQKTAVFPSIGGRLYQYDLSEADYLLKHCKLAELKPFESHIRLNQLHSYCSDYTILGS